MTQAQTPQPENLSIRSRPPNPKRLSRKVLMTSAAMLGLVITFALLTGLSERPDRFSAANTDAQPVAASTMPEGISKLPAKYGEVSLSESAIEPRDMMWGDRGRPEGYDDGMDPTLAEDDYWASEEEPEANYGGEYARTDADAAATETPPAPIFFEKRRDVETSRATDSGGAGDSTQSAFPISDDKVSTRADTRDGAYRPPSSPYELQAGTVIPAALVTAINSDLPGGVIAQVTAPVFDSITGNHRLIPQGARLIGTYDSETVYGDTRVVLKWDRILMPNGWSLDLGEMEATDPSGASGLTDKTDNHLDRLGGAIALSAVLSILANEAEGDNERSFTRSVGDAAAQEAARAGGRIVDRDLNLKPTLRVRPGAPVRVLVTKELALRPYGD